MSQRTSYLSPLALHNLSMGYAACLAVRMTIGMTTRTKERGRRNAGPALRPSELSYNSMYPALPPLTGTRRGASGSTSSTGGSVARTCCSWRFTAPAARV
jgi:hypothetical protein